MLRRSPIPAFSTRLFCLTIPMQVKGCVNFWSRYSHSIRRSISGRNQLSGIATTYQDILPQELPGDIGQLPHWEWLLNCATSPAKEDQGKGKQGRQESKAENWLVNYRRNSKKPKGEPGRYVSTRVLGLGFDDGDLAGRLLLHMFDSEREPSSNNK
ncbi:hypothetical protein PAAG_11114 [Paracoccidioides lutzii Pb01]|uniref:Uncharacterized protein n=1 Tax=Paracoccidioides lutzii (strain ATCC MYA-826 / Pb01) TaxID=502779 RepID=A0A0A2VMX2_PARBA|nr:hypothetical protein PAAG_11114 [Paracoccidioides lutzii Pb01]KGQ02159.1 hypothetical protein PAAG_11114 [Paracoccidioides lutzii Pb01]